MGQANKARRQLLEKVCSKEIFEDGCVFIREGARKTTNYFKYCIFQILATILLHDVVEDCGVKLEHLPVSDAVKRSVQYMTVTSLPHDKSKMETKRRYYAQLLDNKNTFITKALDRQYNLSDMAGIFTPEQIGKNVHETETMFLPLFREAKEKWPELSDVFFVLKENIKQMNNTLYVLFTKEYNEYAEKIKGL